MKYKGEWCPKCKLDLQFGTHGHNTETDKPINKCALCEHEWDSTPIDGEIIHNSSN